MNYYHKALHLGWCSSSRSASDCHLLTICQRVLAQFQTNQSNFLSFKNKPINQFWHNYNRNYKRIISSWFYYSKNIFGRSMKREKVNMKKRGRWKRLFLKLQYCLDLSENSKVVHGRSFTKWASWKCNDILVKED